MIVYRKQLLTERQGNLQCVRDDGIRIEKDVIMTVVVDLGVAHLHMIILDFLLLMLILFAYIMIRKMLCGCAVC